MLPRLHAFACIYYAASISVAATEKCKKGERIFVARALGGLDAPPDGARRATVGL
jgi:hypothetical protein